MGFDARFTLVLAAWVAALLVAVGGVVAAFAIPDLVAARIVAVLLLAGALAGLWSHVQRTYIVLARFVEALHHGDLAARFDRRGARASRIWPPRSTMRCAGCRPTPPGPRRTSAIWRR